MPGRGEIAYQAGTLDPPLVTGNYYMAGQSWASSTNVWTLQQCRVYPHFIPSDCTIVRLGAEVTSAGSAGSLFRIGMWKHDYSTGLPGALHVDAGTIDGTSATVQDKTVSTVIPRGWYWFGGCGTVAAMTMRTLNIGNEQPNLILGTATPSANAACAGYMQASVSGAFGAFTGTTIQSITALARIHFKV